MRNKYRCQGGIPIIATSRDGEDIPSIEVDEDDNDSKLNEIDELENEVEPINGESEIKELLIT